MESRQLLAATAAMIPPPATPLVYRSPLVITHGGVYSGNWQSLNPNVPAVQIRTSEPVIIQNANIRSRGTLINSIGYAANVTVRNTVGYGLNPNVRGLYPGRFVNLEGFSNAVITNNSFEGTAGIYLEKYKGNRTAQQTVKVLSNQAHNIDGRFSNGKGGWLTGPDDNFYVQFFQINGVRGLNGAEIGWNQVVNDPGNSRVEDNISIFSSSGTAKSPFLIHDNYIQGAYPADPVHDTTFTGGGIMLSDIGSSYVTARNNQVIDTTNYGIAISSGSNNVFYSNRIISSGRLPNGTPVASQNVGAYIWNSHGSSGFSTNSGYDNLIAWQSKSQRNDYWVPDAATWRNNKTLAGSVTSAAEAGEWQLWQTKLAGGSMGIGAAAAR